METSPVSLKSLTDLAQAKKEWKKCTHTKDFRFFFFKDGASCAIKMVVDDPTTTSSRATTFRSVFFFNSGMQARGGRGGAKPRRFVLGFVF